MILFETEAVVINSSRLGEADLLVTLLTRDYGKVKAVARGGSMLSSRFSGHLQPLSILDVIYLGRAKEELYRINSCDSVKVYDFSTGLEKVMACCCMVETLELCCGPGETNPPLYDLAVEGVGLLAEKEHSPHLAFSFAMKATKLSGYMPRLDDCSLCGGALQGGKLRFSPAEGGAVCGRCSTTADHYPMTMGCLKFLQASIDLDLKKSSRIKINQRLRNEAGKIISNHLSFYSGREMRSMRFLDL